MPNVKREVAVKSYAENFNTAGYRDDRFRHVTLFVNVN